MNVSDILINKMGHSPNILSGKTAVITGSGSGIGKQVALGLAHLGADIVVIDKNPTAGEAVVSTIQSLGRRSIYIQADIARNGELVTAIETVYEQWKSIDFYINNAMQSFIGSYEEESLAVWDSVFDTNLRYPAAAIRTVLPRMLEWGDGVIANVISLEGLNNSTAYSASKVGMRSLVTSISTEIGNDSGVSLFSFAPGIVDTPTVNDYFYPELAKRFGMTMADIIEGIGGNPGYTGLMPSEHCGAGFVDCLVNAHQYHGQIAGPFLSLAKAGVIDLKEGLQTNGTAETDVPQDGFDAVNKSLRDYLTSVTEINRNLEHRIQTRTQELRAALLEIEEKNDVMAETNKKLIDSIQYAQRIQTAVHPEPEEFTSLLPDSFIIWEPRDIVGGDFYQIFQVPAGIIIVVGDCTGHGVSGGFMTMLAISNLKRIIYGLNLFKPAEILTRLNIILKKALKQDKEISRLDDGLDCAICLIKLEDNSIEYAGARFPLFAVHKGVSGEIKADRKSVGYKRTSLDSAFTTKTFSIKEGMVFYLFSDGYYDQLGGENRTHFGKSRVLDMIGSNAELPLEIQKKKVIEAFQEHQGSNDRQDDVTVVGFKVC